MKVVKRRDVHKKVHLRSYVTSTGRLLCPAFKHRAQTVGKAVTATPSHNL
jgi:hypothetical protein